MPIVSVQNAGAVGVIRDLPPHELPPEAWSDAGNVRFHDGSVEKFLGEAEVFASPTIAPYWPLGVPSAATFFWLYGGLAKVHVWDGTTHTDITRASGGDYNLDPDKPWTGGILNGIPVINNEGDDPQYWSALSVGQRLQLLTNWPASTKAKVLKPFKIFLVALDITEGANNFPHRIKWSASADPGTLPSTWDETDATKDAGETELSDVESGLLLDELALRDINIVYKSSATWGMQFIGGQFVFRFFRIFPETGILATHCAAPLGDGRRHFVMTGDDIITHDGQTAQSVIDHRLRKWLQGSIDTTNFRRSFCTTYRVENEAWFCFPESGNTIPSHAVVWNWQDGTVGVRELGTANFITGGEITGTSTDTFDGGTVGTFDTENIPFGQRPFVPFSSMLLKLDATNTKFFQLDDTNQFDGANFTSYVERTGIPFFGSDRFGQPKVDLSQRKLFTRIWPRMTGNGPVFWRVGTQDEVGGMVNFSAPQSFTPGVDEYLDVCVSGKLGAVRVESTADVDWKLQGYDLEVQGAGGL